MIRRLLLFLALIAAVLARNVDHRKDNIFTRENEVAINSDHRTIEHRRAIGEEVIQQKANVEVHTDVGHDHRTTQGVAKRSANVHETEGIETRPGCCG